MNIMNKSHDNGLVIWYLGIIAMMKTNMAYVVKVWMPSYDIS